MEPHRPRSWAARLAIHLVFVLSLVATGLYYVRLAEERHVALGIHGTVDQNALFVRDGSEADRAGMEVGDRLANPDRSFLVGFLSDGPTHSFTTYRGRDTLEVTLNLKQSMPIGARIAAIPPDMRTSALIGILALLLGWWIFARNPDQRGIIPFALWSAATAPFWVSEVWSAYWSYEMWSVNTIWTIPVETAFQAFAMHWLLIFPRRLVKRWVVVVMYAVMVTLAIALFAVAVVIEDKPVDLMSIKGLVAAGMAFILCVIQLRQAESLRARRQAGWVLLGVAFFSLVSFFLWDAPYLAGISLPFGRASAEMVAAASYLAVPVGIALAITREGLFRIDRFITRGMALGATLLLVFFMYVGAAYLITALAGIADRSSLPVFWGFAIACAIALLARPIHVGIESVLDRFVSRERQRYESALETFDMEVRTVADRKSLERLACRAITAGLGTQRCSMVKTGPGPIRVAPGTVAADTYSGKALVDDAMPGDVCIRYPIFAGDHYFGTADIGPKENNLRYSDGDLLFLERVAFRCADQSARMELYDRALRRELEFAQTRLRIASDLHDDIGSNLSGIALMTETAADSPDGRDRLIEISRFARSMVESLRDIVWSIDPESDSPGQLVGRMKDAASAMLPGMRHFFDVDGTLEGSASPVFQRNVFLIFKEAIHNIARHAAATEVRIMVRASDDEFILEVADNGAGFDTSLASGGLGRKTMVRRAERIGGDLAVESAPGHGTKILLTVKMAQTRHADTISES